MTIELGAEHDVSDPGATPGFMNSMPRQQRNDTAGDSRPGSTGRARGMRRYRGLLVGVAAVSVLKGCSPTNPPTMVRTTVTAHAPTRTAAIAGANDAGGWSVG
ncbi:hypothetical protein [Mycolicibacterium llatzerense]|uniref:hypothetical protein n=1 Tax=Mycolicibacterium llatzerense TaxID=280871 RepID=UPI0008DE115E|nr:hypothetical protein [Mycolicibacterium llatzerense]